MSAPGRRAFSLLISGCRWISLGICDDMVLSLNRAFCSGGIYGQTKHDLDALSTCSCFGHGKIVVYEEKLPETIVGNQMASSWSVMFSTRDESQQKITLSTRMAVGVRKKITAYVCNGHVDPCGTRNSGLTHHTSSCCIWGSLRIGNELWLRHYSAQILGEPEAAPSRTSLLEQPLQHLETGGGKEPTVDVTQTSQKDQLLDHDSVAIEAQDELIADDEETEKEKALDGALWEELNKRIQEAQQTKGESMSVMKLEEMLRHLQADAHPEDPRIASVALRLGQEYDSSGESPDKVLRYGQQALQVLKMSSISDPLETAMCYHLIASAHNKLGHHDVSLANLKHALHIIQKHEGPEYGPVMFAVHFLLGDTFAALGKHDESLHHYSKGLSVQETFLEPGHPHLASSYRQVGEAFTQVMRFDDAKTLAKKALESHLKIHGEGSIEEAIDRRLLSVIYSGLEDHEKALEEQLLVRKILQERNIGSETVFVEISTADTQITLGKFDDAIVSLQSALSQMAEDSPMRSLATVNLAKAYAGLGKMEQARSYCSMAMDIVNNRSKGLAAKDPHALAVAEAFTELSAIYEQMNQPEEAIGLLKRALTVFAEIPEQKNAAAGTQAQVGLLLINNGQLEAALPHLEDAVEKLRQSFGDNHFSLGLVLNHLGVAHLDLGHPVKALKILEEAKEILSKAYGPSHSDTLGSYESLVNVYSKLGRYEEAIACARHIVSELKEQGNEDAFLEAQRKLRILEDQKARNAK